MAPNTTLIFVEHRSALVDYAATILGSRTQAEDLVQEAWVRFDEAARQQLLREPLGYLYRIVRNLALDGRRRAARERAFISQSIELEGSRAHSSITPEAETAAREELKLLIAAMEELPERTRIAVEMRRLDGRKLKDIAAALGVSVPVAYQIVAEGLAHCLRRIRAGR